MRALARIVLIAAVVAALAATYQKLENEKRAAVPRPADTPRAVLVERLRTLPEAPPSWKLLESAPDEMNLDEIPDIQPALVTLLESARKRVVFESYFLKKSLGRAAQWLERAPASGIQVLGVLHPNPMSDAPLLNDLRSAGAQVVERDIAPAGGDPREGYIHAKFVVVDGARGYLGSANFGAAAMGENREMGLYFEDAAVAQTLELMASFDAGRLGEVLVPEFRSAVLVQGAPQKFRIEGLPLCEDGAAALCDLAKNEIDIMMFTFSHQFGTYDAIATPLRAAVRRGVTVRLIHDARTVKEIEGVRPTLRDMKQWGVDVRLADIAALGKTPGGQYHAKAMQVDDEFLMIGSNNWTEAATHENREAAILLRSRTLAAQFRSLFNADWSASEGVRVFVP